MWADPPCGRPDAIEDGARSGIGGGFVLVDRDENGLRRIGYEPVQSSQGSGKRGRRIGLPDRRGLNWVSCLLHRPWMISVMYKFGWRRTPSGPVKSRK
jgi:hypothetical protein